LTTPHHPPAEFRAGRDLLDYTFTATPSADVWIATFATRLVQQPTAAYATDALMSGLRFYTAAFVAEIAALPPVASRLPPLTSHAVQAIYTATGPIIVAVYQNLIRRNAEPVEIQAAFAQAAEGLLTTFHTDVSSTNGGR
jgi:hypothetical protein